jgi:galactokinase
MEKILILKFKEKFNKLPQIISSAPGRINIIGEHTDYTLGYVLPSAIDKKIYFLASKRNDSEVNLWSEQFKEKDIFSLEKIEHSTIKRWTNYVRGVFNLLIQKKYSLKGIDGLIWGNIPIGAGLSSSAAFEVSILNCLNNLFDLYIEKKDIAIMAQKVEQEFVGVQCGIMDQFISLFGKRDKALFLDCESLEFEEVPLNLKKNNISILIYDTGIKRDLSSSAYNERRSEAEQALRILRKEYKINTFKEVSLEMLEKSKNLLSKKLFKRAKHIITENNRVKKAVSALRKDDFKTLRKLLFESHLSLKDDYEVSCPELDFFYEKGLEFQGCFGARLTGAGFGGSAIALVKRNLVKDFEELLLKESQKYYFKKPEFYEVFINSGAEVKILN